MLLRLSVTKIRQNDTKNVVVGYELSLCLSTIQYSLTLKSVCVCVCVRERGQGTEMERESSKLFCIRNQKEAICIILKL